jgi:hypothetical protein
MPKDTDTEFFRDMMKAFADMPPAFTQTDLGRN